MPVFNADQWLGDTLASITEQTLQNFELIAIDDGSSDNSRNILLDAAARDPRIRVLQSPAKGIVAALNFGIGHCRGEYIARMDADDLMPEQRLELQASYLDQHQDISLVTGKVLYLGDAAANAGYARYVDWLNTFETTSDYFNRRFVESPVAHPSVMGRANVFKANTYHDGDFPEDYDLWLRLLALGHQFATVAEPVLAWRDHGTRASRTDARYDIEKFYAHKASYLAAWLRERGHESVTVWSGGRRSRRRIDALRMQGIKIETFVDVHPRRIGQVIQGAEVVSPDVFFARPRRFIIVYVSSRGAREIIGASLAEQGFSEGENYVFAS